MALPDRIASTSDYQVAVKTTAAVPTETKLNYIPNIVLDSLIAMNYLLD